MAKAAKENRWRVYLNRKPYRVIATADRPLDGAGKPCDAVRDDRQRVVWLHESLTSSQRDRAVFLIGLASATRHLV